MTAQKSPHAPLAEDDPESIQQFASRLALLVGDRSLRGFARDVGISDKMLRQYLAGRSEPTRGVLVSIARAGGHVSLNWLLSGDGDMMRRSGSDGTGAQARPPDVVQHVTQFPQRSETASAPAVAAGKADRWVSAKDEFTAWLNQWWRQATPRERAWLEIQLEAYVPQFVVWRKTLRKRRWQS